MKYIEHLKCKFYEKMQFYYRDYARVTIIRKVLIAKTSNDLYVPSAAITATSVSPQKTERLVRFMKFSFVSKMRTRTVIVGIVAVIA